MATAVTESILASTKAAVGILPTYDGFDNQIIMYINTAFSVLHQLGVGPDEGFFITDDTATWDDYLDGKRLLKMVITYVHMSVRLMFDPPSNSSAASMMEQQRKELEWRINVAVDPELEEKSYG